MARTPKPQRGQPEPPREWIEIIPRILRRADLVAGAPAGGVYILLPETPASGIPAIRKRLAEALTQTSLSERAAAPAPRISQAAYPRDGETPEEILEALTEEIDPGFSIGD